MPEPPVLAVEVVEKSGEWLGLRLGSSHVPVPRESYLRQIRDTDVESVDELAALAAWGIWRPLAHPARDLGIEVEPPAGAVGYWGHLSRFHAEARGSTPVPDYQQRDGLFRLGVFPVHVDEIAIRVRLLQRAADHVEAHHSAESLRSVWRDCRTDGEAWEQFYRWSTAALRDFHVRVIIEAHDNEDPEMRRGDVYTTVYGVAWLQLVNDLAEGLPMRVCANETCGRSFVRQLGRSVYGQNKTEGIRYCSADCARAQAQRDYRRRNKRKAEQ